MTAEEYWEGDSALPIFYRKSFALKQKRDLENMDCRAWLNGKYMAEAISTCFGKDFSYPDKPYSYKKAEENELNESKTEEEIMIENVERFRMLVEAKNKQKAVKKEWE